ncbi:MAG: hypothetical protein ACLFQB_15020 [Chitinispirillaceae bacterium]
MTSTQMVDRFREKRFRILLAEDDEVNREVGLALLGKTGLRQLGE